MNEIRSINFLCCARWLWRPRHSGLVPMIDRTNQLLSLWTNLNDRVSPCYSCDTLSYFQHWTTTVWIPSFKDQTKMGLNSINRIPELEGRQTWSGPRYGSRSIWPPDHYNQELGYTTNSWPNAMHFTDVAVSDDAKDRAARIQMT